MARIYWTANNLSHSILIRGILKLVRYPYIKEDADINITFVFLICTIKRRYINIIYSLFNIFLINI